MAPVLSVLIPIAVLAASTASSAADPGTFNVIVTLRDGTSSPLNALQKEKFASREQKLGKLKDSLQTHAKKSQTEVQGLLGKAEKSAFVDFESFWVTNQVFVRGANAKLLDQLKALPSVADVSLERVHAIVAPVFETGDDLSATTAARAGGKKAPAPVPAPTPSPTPTLAPTPAPTSTSTPTPTPTLTASISWGVNKINTTATWARGNTGANIVVGTIDTGVRATHQALSANFRSSFGWYDPETKATKPYDCAGHGTHVMGTIVGATGIGVAPGAQWIACKGCRATGCYTSDLLTCFQFMLCPTTPDGKVQDCSKSPRVVNNSWGGGQGDKTYSAVIDAWKAAGIIPVFAAGNTGPSCGTVISPGDLPGVISVGATDSNDALASFSSKGPSVSGCVKPDVSAPGASIRSACYTGDADYCTKSGTSMAAPHVTGAIALYLSANPTATFDQVKQYLQTTAVTSPLVKSGYACGSTPDGVFPNNQFGYGRIVAPPKPL